jgi:O-antigen/teichoic acid export membrane protein
MTAALPRYLGASDEQSKPFILGSGFRITLISSIISFPIFWFIQKKFEIIKDSGLVNAIFIYAIILTFFYLVQSLFQGLKQFKRLSILWIVSALGFVGAVLFYLFVLHNFSFLSLYGGNVIRLGFVIAIGLILFGRQLFFYSREKSRELMHFGSYSMLSVVAGFFSLGSIDNIMINRYLGPSAVGLYAAYYVAFSVFVSKILNAFLQVFLPMASGHPNLYQLLKGVLKIALKFGILMYIGMVAMIRILFYFYGRDFVFDWKIALTLAFNVTLYGFMIVSGYTITAKGLKGARYGFISAVLAAMVNVTLDIVLIPRYQLLGSVYASIVATVSIITFQLYVVRTGYLESN